MQISHNAKGTSLLSGLEIGFRMAVGLGGAEKAIIFTESRRTQQYLLDLLSRQGYADKIVDVQREQHRSEVPTEIYDDWMQRTARSVPIT